MTCHLPFMPHELDIHPDGKRILTTIETELQKSDQTPWKDRYETAVADLHDLEKEYDRLNDRHEAVQTRIKEALSV